MKMENSYLLEKLKLRYPNQLPTESIDSFEYGKLLGQQEVILYIYTILDSNDRENQQENIK